MPDTQADKLISELCYYLDEMETCETEAELLFIKEAFFPRCK